MNKSLASVTISLLALAFNSLAVTPDQLASGHLLSLVHQGVSEESILGVDENGVPRVCGTGLQTTSSLVAEGTNSTSNLLPAGMRSWECIPNVIRNDGVDSFRLEVDANGPVTQVTLDGFTTHLVSQSGLTSVVLRDDGSNGDRVANDYVFTSENLRYRTLTTMPAYQGLSTNTPMGLYMADAGNVHVFETNGTQTVFLTPPCVAILNTNIPLIETVMLAPDIKASAHLINLVTTNREAQRSLRTSSSLSTISQRVYPVMPDAFDFLSFFTTDHIEYTPQLTADNFVSGRHFRARVNYTGTGIGLLDGGLAFGSTTRLLGLNVFDTMKRGINFSTNPTHEYCHQWGARTSTTLGLSTGEGHFK